MTVVPNWAIWAVGMVFVLVNVLAWTLIRINDIPPAHESSSGKPPRR